MSKSLSLNKILKRMKFKKQGSIQFSRYSLEDYEGMYDEYIILYGFNKRKYTLIHSFACYVLDFFGDDSEDIRYEFLSVEELIDYVEEKLNLKLKDMTIFERAKIPTIFDITDEERLIYDKVWDRFRQDFDSGKFLDKDLKLINS